MKLCEGIYLAGSGFDGLFLTDRLDCNVYVFDTGSGWAMLDAGLGREPERILDILRGDGLSPSDIKYLMLTHAHADHMGGAAYFRNRLGAAVIAPKLEAGIAERAIESEMGMDVAKAAGYYPSEMRIKPCKIERTVSAGEKFVLGKAELTCYGAKGHSPGGLCYHMKHKGKNVLFSGDLIRHGGHISLQDIPGGSLTEYMKSISELKSAEVDIFLPGHGAFSMQNGYEHIELAAKEQGVW